MKEQEELIKNLNAFAKKAKEGTLTEEERRQQESMRKEYLVNFREGFKSQIEMMKLYDKDGKEITSHKVKDIQREKGLRDD